MPGVPMYICVQLRAPIPMVRPYHRCAAARHETHHGHVLRHAMEHVYHGRPPGTIHPHRVVPPPFARPFLPSPGYIFFRLFSISSLSSRYFSFRILPVIGSKVNRSKVIFSSRSLPLVPRERSISCSSFYSSALLFFFTLYFPSFLFHLSLI